MRCEILWLSLGLSVLGSAPPTILCEPMQLTSPKTSGTAAVMVKTAQWVDYLFPEGRDLKKVTSERQHSASWR
jgi:hypothetical protein